MDTAITFAPKIQDTQTGLAFAKNFAKNPPSNPIDAIKQLGSAMGVGGAISLGIAAAFPVAAPFLPIISGIFDLFGGDSGPSIGEVTLQELGKIENQIAQSVTEINSHVDEVVAEQANRTISLVLTGIDDAAKQASALSVMSNLKTSKILDDAELRKTALLMSYTDNINSARKSFIADVSKSTLDAQAMTDAKWKVATDQVASVAGALIAPITEKLQAAQDDLLEIQEIQKQIDDINGTDLKGLAHMLVGKRFKTW